MPLPPWLLPVLVDGIVDAVLARIGSGEAAPLDSGAPAPSGLAGGVPCTEGEFDDDPWVEQLRYERAIAEPRRLHAQRRCGFFTCD